MACIDCIHKDVCGNAYRKIVEPPNVCGCFRFEDEFVEVKHGKWLVCNGIVSCSVCKENAKLEDYDDTAPFGGYAETKYCPHCGAKMDGGKANDL